MFRASTPACEAVCTYQRQAVYCLHAGRGRREWIPDRSGIALKVRHNRCEGNNMRPIVSCLIAAALSLGLVAEPSSAATDDLKVLLKGVREVAAPGWPGMLLR